MHPVVFPPPVSLEPFADTAPVSLDALLDAAESGAIVLTVNRRLSRHLVERFERRQAGRDAAYWETPSILPWGAWLQERHDAALATGASERVRLAPLACERAWQRLVDADRSLPPLLAPSRTARAARRAWGLAHAWRCLPTGEDYLSRDQYHWRQWSLAYRDVLDVATAEDDATLPDHVASLAADGMLELPTCIVFAGFLFPTPQQRALARALADAGVVVSALDDGAAGALSTERFADDATELAGVADAVFRRVAERPGELIGVVVPDLDSRRDAVLRAFDRRFFPTSTPREIEACGRPYDLSYGQPLADLPPVRAALLALRLAFSGLDADEASSLLLCPYLEAADAERADRERIDRNLRSRRVQRLDLKGFAMRLADSSPLRESLFAFAGRKDGAGGDRLASPVRWAERFTSCLRAFGWPGPAPSSEEFQASAAWRSVLDDLQTLDDGEVVTASAALGLVGRLARERLFQPETADGPVRVLGRLESHGQRFDAMWVTGLDAERWPPKASPEPFLPVSRQREAGMPEVSVATRLAFARREFAHWRASADDVTVSCVAERGDQPVEPAFTLIDPVTREGEAFDPVAAIRAAATVELVDDATGPANLDEGRVRGGAKLLEHQAVCPMRAFVEHRLGARPIELFEIGLGRHRQGTLMHAALEHFWTELRSQAELLALDEAALDALVGRAVEAAFEKERVDADLRGIEETRLHSVMLRWVADVELRRPPFEIVAIEERREVVRSGVRMQVQIDRIDRVGDALVIIDYKTGKVPSQKVWDEPRIATPQLPLYALTDEAVEAVAFGAIGQRRPICRGLGADGAVLPGVSAPKEEDWTAVRARWAESLDAIAAETCAGHAAVAPVDDQACRWCPVRPVCRRDADEGAFAPMTPAAAPSAT